MAESAETQTTETTEGTEGKGTEAASEKTLTQAEVDAIVEQRLARERKKFSDYEDLKAKAAAHDKAEAEKLSELERERKAREDAEARMAELKSERDAEKIRSAIVAEAVKQGAKSTDAVLRAIDKTGLTIGDDGQVSGAEDAVKALLTEIPEFVGGGSGSQGSGDQGARGGGPSQITQEQMLAMSPEERTTALREGKLSHLL